MYINFNNLSENEAREMVRGNADLTKAQKKRLTEMYRAEMLKRVYQAEEDGYWLDLREEEELLTRGDIAWLAATVRGHNGLGLKFEMACKVTPERTAFMATLGLGPKANSTGYISIR